MSKRIIRNSMVACIMMVILLGSCLFFQRNDYYLVCLGMIALVFIPFLIRAERRIRLREILLIAVMSAIAVTSRILFFAFPQVKPMSAIVILTAVAMGPEAGFVTGVMTAFVSNFFFGQGLHTPFQMFALGMVGMLAGCLFYGKKVEQKWNVVIYGVLSVLVLYGGIVDANTLFMTSRYPTWEQVYLVYVAGIPLNVVHAISTGIFLFLLYQPICRRLSRIAVKYRI